MHEEIDVYKSVVFVRHILNLHWLWFVKRSAVLFYFLRSLSIPCAGLELRRVFQQRHRAAEDTMGLLPIAVRIIY